jgi:hypothetical protein
VKEPCGTVITSPVAASAIAAATSVCEPSVVYVVPDLVKAFILGEKLATATAAVIIGE